MMNMFQLQERIKDFSKDQLVREMQQPSGAVPPFLVLSELQRRTRMEKAFQAEQAQGQQSTVAQDAIAAAGVPQGGIADMARAMAPQTDMTQNTGAAPVQAMAEGGEVRRMQPGGLTGNDELDEALRELERARIRMAEATRAARGDDEALSEVSADVGAFTPAPISAAPAGTTRGLPGIDAAQNPLGRLRPMQLETQPLVGPSADTAPIADLAPPTFTNTDILRETIRRGDRPLATMSSELDPRFYPTEGRFEPMPSPMQGPNQPTDGGIGRLFAAGAGVALPQMSAEPIDPMQGPNLPLPPVDPSELGGLPDFMVEPRGTVPEPQPGEGIMPSDIGRAIGEAVGFGPAMDAARATRAMRATPDPLPMDTGTSLTVPEEADGGIEALLPPRPAAAVAGGTSGGAGARTTGAADADKWLALAQFGLGLMASQQPTLGGAIGEAGTMALGQLRESQKEAFERDLAERTLAARTAGAGRARGPSFSNLITYANALGDSARAALEALDLAGVSTLEEALDKGRGDEFRQATRDLAEAQRLLRSLGPAVGGGESGNVEYDLTQTN